jgi:GLPGLI family protein
MKNKIIFFLTLICIYSSAQESYKVIYRANYISNLDTKALKTERTLLIIDSNKSSYYASENTYKQDSIKQLVRSKILTPQEAMNDNIKEQRKAAQGHKKADNGEHFKGRARKIGLTFGPALPLLRGSKLFH